MLTLYNIWDAHRADVAAQTAVQALKEMIPTLRTAPEQERQPGSPEAVLPDSREETEGAGEDIQRESEGETGMKSKREALMKSTEPSRGNSEREIPESPPEKAPEQSQAEPRTESEDGAKEATKRLRINHFFAEIPQDREMPTKLLNGYRYIGVLDVDSLELSLPVMDRWDYERLKVSPCRFAGNVYQDNLVICAHNYAHHFTPLKYVPIGTEVKFTDMEGNTFRYAVSSFETIGPNDVEGMVNGDWDLTLFTCNTSGQTRCAIRCDRIHTNS